MNYNIGMGVGLCMAAAIAIASTLITSNISVYNIAFGQCAVGAWNLYVGIKAKRNEN